MMTDWEKVEQAFDMLEELEPFLCDLAERGDYKAKTLHERVLSILDEEEER
jgi:hypothetical protein